MKPECYPIDLNIRVRHCHFTWTRHKFIFPDTAPNTEAPRSLMKSALTSEVHAALIRCAHLLLRRAAEFQLDAVCSLRPVMMLSALCRHFSQLSRRQTERPLYSSSQVLFSVQFFLHVFGCYPQSLYSSYGAVP